MRKKKDYGDVPTHGDELLKELDTVLTDNFLHCGYEGLERSASKIEKIIIKNCARLDPKLVNLKKLRAAAIALWNDNLKTFNDAGIDEEKRRDLSWEALNLIKYADMIKDWVNAQASGSA